MVENRENRPDIYCPFRVFRQERPPMLRGNGTSTTEEFYPCLGKRCAAYYNGGCLRLVAPKDWPTFAALDDPESVAMIERLTVQVESGSRLKAPEKIGFNQHNCEARYVCPYCKKPFGDWDVYHQEKQNGTNNYCPHCKKEFAKF